MSERYIITTKTPFRITFSGGGTDLPYYFRTYGTGVSVSATINSYVYITISKHFYEDELRISYSTTENAIKNIEEIKHPTIREAMKLLKMKTGIQLVSITEIPSQGTGLGSSSSFLVGVLNALHAWKGEVPTPKQLAEEAINIERNILKEPGGFQDQYAAAYGGINTMEFFSDDTVAIKRIPLSRNARKELESNLILFYTGSERSSLKIHKQQAVQISNKIDSYKKMSKIAYETGDALSKLDFKKLGSLLDENWKLKQTLSTGITTDFINAYYNKAINAGALGGKLIGAGGSGFLLFIVPNDKREEVKKAVNLKEHNFEIEPQGSRVIYVD
ncbi:MAG: kinase [Candidatus Micrarchaeia archaeon]